ncbi:hypothetical protein PF010_g2245 [Phytophthora fragariae]|uniref:Uncharacterized protein n=1 Tax=Phytophthora fragariae TaxID=53985 RepID=A0A6A3LQ56_9STRA|nr:hypothetical protein PF011_g4982 [Phytophthora fragariae]KAE9134997.1 hypothetical protein PF010_g2245 [Phytophthora fragariae]KAE9251499.1 hypothetical protein PF004_g2441 [Phytophthora fragariae]
MRWYCMHPGLPVQAELRVRASPDSSAAERARVSHGRAIAACSPVFQVAGDAADDAPISWLQVAYQDAASGETEGGFMMASLPEGTPLVTPWETTNFCGCCEVTDPAALLFDGPQETARSLGAVQSVNLLYCIVEEREGKLRIFHPTIQSAWIDMKDVHVVCVRLKHDRCSTLHTFYELNEALPEEAQIAIREFPSKEAQTVGLLSRGETLEVTVRGGNWLQIAGGNVDKAWIMWRTDALELLQEAPDVCSGNCTTRTDTAVTDIGVLDQDGCVDNQTEPSSLHEVAEETTGGVASAPNCEIDATPEVNAVAVAVASIATDDVSAVASDPPPTKCIDDTTKTAEFNDPCQEGALHNDTVHKARDQPLRPGAVLLNGVDNAESSTADMAPVVDDSTIADDKDTVAEAVAGGEVEEASPMQTEESWDDRPIRPAPTAFDVSGGASGEEEDAPAWDDRPIRPAPAVPDDLSSGDDEAVDVEAEVDDGSVAEDKDTVADVVAGGEVEEASPMQTEESWDDRPIRPAPTAFDVSGGASGEAQDAPAWDDRPIRNMAKGGESIGVKAEAAADINAAANDADEVLGTANGVEPTQSSSVWEDRPIRSVRTRQDEDGNGASSDYSSATTRDETKMCASRPIESQDGTAKENLSVFGSASIESPGARRMQPGHFSQQVNPFERRYAESETTSGSESGEIALLGGLEDVFDPVDELLPAMAEDIIQEIDDGITGVLSAAISEPVSLGAVGVGENLDDANRSAQEKTPFGDSSPSDGLSYLQHFGIGKYCEHKQSLITPSDELAQAMYEANQDDSDLVFQALVGDEPLSDDWFHDVSLRDLHAGPHLRAVPKTTYDLIMANASPEDILEAELLDDDEGDFDLVMSFKYPVPKRRALEPSRSPSLFRRVPSAPTGMSVLETKAAISPAKPPSESDLNADGSPPGSRQPSPASRRTSVSARTSPVPAKSTTPPKSPVPRQPVGPPSTPVPPAGSRLMQRKSIATLSSIGKPPSSLMRPRSFVQPSHLAAPASPALSKPVASGLAPPSRASGSSISAASTPSIATPTRSLLQRRSMLSAPSPAKTIGSLSTTRSSITGSIPKPTEVSSGLQAPRKSFGFRRPSGLAKKT